MLLGRDFGNLGHVKNVIQFGTSPYEIRAFPNLLGHPKNLMIRVYRQWMYTVPRKSICVTI